VLAATSVNIRIARVISSTLDASSPSAYALTMLVLPFLLSLPTCVADVGSPVKEAQLAVIAQAIEAATPRLEERAALITLAWFESRLCLAVHSGARLGGDGEGLWQLEPGSRRERPFSGLGAAETEHAAGQALWLWRRSHCRGQGLPARFRVYAGLGCAPSSWAGAAPRARFLAWVAAELRRPARWEGKALALMPQLAPDPSGNVAGRVLVSWTAYEVG
jgi:hypothetical protein